MRKAIAQIRWSTTVSSAADMRPTSGMTLIGYFSWAKLSRPTLGIVVQLGSQNTGHFTISEAFTLHWNFLDKYRRLTERVDRKYHERNSLSNLGFQTRIQLRAVTISTSSALLRIHTNFRDNIMIHLTWASFRLNERMKKRSHKDSGEKEMDEKVA